MVNLFPVLDSECWTKLNNLMLRYCSSLKLVVNVFLHISAFALRVFNSLCVHLSWRLVVFYAAARALDVLNFTPLNSKAIRIMYSHRDPSIRKSGTANIFIKVSGFQGLRPSLFLP